MKKLTIQLEKDDGGYRLTHVTDGKETLQLYCANVAEGLETMYRSVGMEEAITYLEKDIRHDVRCENFTNWLEKIEQAKEDIIKEYFKCLNDNFNVAEKSIKDFTDNFIEERITNK